MNKNFTSEIELYPGISEKAVRFPVDGHRLAGNLVQPETTAKPGIVFVHGWSGIRSGPHDILTHLARHLAKAGFPSLRFDLRGRGESDGNGMETTLPTMASDLVAATDFLRKTCEVRKIILFGMCSGGNVAIGTLPQIPGTAGMVLLSVYPFSDGDSFGRSMNRTWHFAQQYWAKALRGETWRRLFKGEVRIFQVFNVLFGHFFRSKKTMKPTPSDDQQENPAEKARPKKHLANLRSDLPALMIYGSQDPDTNAARAYFQEYATEHDLPIQFIEIEGGNHNFSSRQLENQIAVLVTDFCSGLVS